MSSQILTTDFDPRMGIIRVANIRGKLSRCKLSGDCAVGNCSGEIFRTPISTGGIKSDNQKYDIKSTFTESSRIEQENY